MKLIRELPQINVLFLCHDEDNKIEILRLRHHMWHGYLVTSISNEVDNKTFMLRFYKRTKGS